MSYPSPWILVNRWIQSKTSLDGITRRQFTPTCEADQLWYLDWFLRVGPAGGFAYAIFDTAEYLSDTLEWKDVKFGFSPEPWPTFFGTKEYLEWDNVRVCEGANI